MNRPRLLPLLLFSALVIVMFFLTARVFLFDGASSIAWRKSWNCFVGPAGLAVTMVAAVTCLIWGRDAAKKAIGGMSGAEVWLLFPILGCISLLIGWKTFQVSTFTHEMHDWPWPAFAQLSLANFGRSLLASAVAILATRPWRFLSSINIKQLNASAIGLALLNYLMAFMSYVVFQKFGEQ